MGVGAGFTVSACPVAKHHGGAAGATDASAHGSGGGAGVGADADLKERTSAAAAQGGTQQDRLVPRQNLLIALGDGCIGGERAVEKPALSWTPQGLPAISVTRSSSLATTGWAPGAAGP